MKNSLNIKRASGPKHVIAPGFNPGYIHEQIKSAIGTVHVEDVDFKIQSRPTALFVFDFFFHGLKPVATISAEATPLDLHQ